MAYSAIVKRCGMRGEDGHAVQVASEYIVIL